MIGSKSKRDQVFKELISQGYAEEELDRVYSPIGVNIRAEMPGEIAVSIVGELIRVRAEREDAQWGKSSETGACCRLIAPDK